MIVHDMVVIVVAYFVVATVGKGYSASYASSSAGGRQPMFNAPARKVIAEVSPNVSSPITP